MRWMGVSPFNIHTESTQTAVSRLLNTEHIGVLKAKLPQRGMNHLRGDPQIKTGRQSLGSVNVGWCWCAALR